MKNIGIIGLGNMGYAIAGSLKKTLPDITLSVIDKNTKQSEKCAKELHGKNHIHYKEFFEEAEICIIAVKPQHLETLFLDIAPYTRGKKIITIAAGKKISFFTDNLHTNQVVRFMPNIAARESMSMTGISYGDEVTEEFREEAVKIAEAFGESILLQESLMPAITGLSGSGIAYVFSFIHALALGGTSSGIPYEKSLNISIKTIEGALAMLKSENSTPVDSLTKVISAGGTTIAGIKALEERSFTAAVMEAVERASKRAVEFEK